MTVIPPSALATRRIATRGVAVRHAVTTLEPGHPLARILALYLFLLPFSHLSPAPGVRIRILQLPNLGGRWEDHLGIGVLLMPEFLFGVGMLVTALLVTGRWIGRAPLSRGGRVLVTVSVLALVTALPATVAGDPVGPAVLGWVSVASALSLGVAVAILRPTEATVRLWVLAFIFGSAAISAVAIRSYLLAFGVPESLAVLPANRLHPFYEDYARITYGHSGNTAAVLTVTASMTLAMLAAPRQSLLLRVVLALVLAVFIVNLAFAFQRWAWVTLAASLVAVIWRYRRSGTGLTLLVVLSLVVLQAGAIVAGQLGDYFVEGSSLTAGGSNIGSRIAAWAWAWDLIRLNPAGYGISLTPTLGLPNVIAHNLLVDAAVEGGVLYAACIGTWAGYVLLRTAGAAFRLQLTPARFAALLGGAALTTWTVFFGLTVNLGHIILVTLWVVPAAMALGAPETVERPTLAVPPHER
ncbi:MAG: hypothetical protein AMXMBFR23_04780 [Chloroflexota bacterium]